MEKEIENIENIVAHWKESAELDFKTMDNLLKTEDNSWALFLGHLVLEKLLKAHYVKSLRKHAIFTHDLLRLALKINMNLSNEFEEWLDEISTFNLNTRYDNYRNDFRNLCTNEFTTIWVERIKILKSWLIEKL